MYNLSPYNHAPDSVLAFVKNRVSFSPSVRVMPGVSCLDYRSDHGRRFGNIMLLNELMELQITPFGSSEAILFTWFLTSRYTQYCVYILLVFTIINQRKKN